MPRTVTQYYTSLKHFDTLYDRVARKMPAPTDNADAFKAWQAEALTKLWELLGLDLMEKCPLETELYETWQGDGFRVERVRIQSAPGLYIPLIVLVPDGMAPGEKRPVFMHCFGHGMTTSMIDCFSPDPQDMLAKLMSSGGGIGVGGCKNLLKQGYIIVAADSRGTGERYEAFDTTNAEVYDIGFDNQLNNVASAFGLSKSGMDVWDMIRIVDYILTRDDCNGHVGVGGSSGGGHQSLFHAALDERIDLILTSVWFYGFKESFVHIPHNCSCNFPPNLFKYFDVCDIGALVAPRALQVEAGGSDHLNGHMTHLGNMMNSWMQTKRYYELLGAADKLWVYVYDGGHGCPDPVNPNAPAGGKMTAFVNKYMPLSE